MNGKPQNGDRGVWIVTLPHEVQHLRDSPLGTKSITWVEEYLGTKKGEEGLILSGRCAVDV